MKLIVMKNPKISVVTVCYNAVAEMENTILSVVNQSYSNIEYIIIDGASSDGTVEVVNKYRSKISYFISEPDQGIYDAMNKGIKAATGDWINFMNAGDSFYSDTVIESLVSIIDNSSSIIYGDTVLKYRMGMRLQKPDSLDSLLFKMPFGHQSVFVKTSYHKENLFDVSFRSSGDFNFFHNAFVKGIPFQYVPLIIALFFAEDGISSTNWELAAKEDARIIGIDETLEWKLKYQLRRISVKLKGKCKKYLPKHIVMKMQLKNINKVGKPLS